jgi:hypothetical protein
MLYFGVQLNHHSLKITALSPGFALLTVDSFHFGQASDFNKWVSHLKETPDEPTQWFFDENELNHPNFPHHFFDFIGADDALFTVNHRALCNLMQFISEALVCQKITVGKQDSDFFLASALRIFAQQHLQAVDQELRVF